MLKESTHFFYFLSTRKVGIECLSDQTTFLGYISLETHTAKWIFRRCTPQVAFTSHTALELLLHQRFIREHHYLVTNSASPLNTFFSGHAKCFRHSFCQLQLIAFDQ